MDHETCLQLYGDLAFFAMNFEQLIQDFIQRNIQILNYISPVFVNNWDMTFVINNAKSEGVPELLGFQPGEIKGKVESPYIADSNASFPLIYIYCDLVEPQIVCDIQASLLKIVKVEGKKMEKCSPVDMMGRLHVDLFNQDRLLLNLTDLKIKLIRRKTEFFWMGDGYYKVVFDHISLFVRKVLVNPGVFIGHAKALEKATAKYPIDRVACKVFSIPQSSYSFIQDNVFSGRCPNDWYWLRVDNDAFNGNYKKSPFEFNFLGVYVDGQPMPHQPLELDFEKDNYIRAYQNLFLQSGGLYLSRTEFLKDLHYICLIYHLIYATGNISI
ncbi:uncharacterized protein F54H12.2 [Trichonephila inaurata madagascariensis]|uniref:Uncharacterized protein F54H12.2 n=1 Tax=Trichonephila inaurata madagascariensis TaxID=2747483 RepID=A0A8X7CPX7_9ARAC|nr:uncharacterized protein F54H12.2 [Trichonephila inaurata madagascariensis]